MTYQNKIKQAKSQIDYFNKRIVGVNKALDTAKNKAVRSALETELKTLRADIKALERVISDAEDIIRRQS